jgi:cellulose 1,4-beta-cellobiosidase
MQGCGGSSASAGGGGRGNPPATPTDLAATPSNHQVSLTWNTATTASSYNVSRSTTSGGPYTHAANATVSNDTDTGLANGTTYYYVVSAVNANGESVNSSAVSATPNIPPPGVPTGLTATAANLQVVLAWNAITGATSYNVKRATTTGGPYAKVGS